MREQVTPKRLGAVGPDLFPDRAYATSSGIASFGTGPSAEIPFVVEAWAAESANMRLLVCVNRTPVTGNIDAARDKREIDLFGCGLHHTVAEAPKDKNFDIRLNITTPYMPITSDGKEPNLEPFLDGICDAVAKAVRKARRPDAKEGMSQKDVVLDNLDDAIAAVSGEEGYRFNARQLFYFLRPIVMEETGKELKIDNFTSIITDYENENGEIPLMYREPRGSITHPHRDETITLGTLMVEEYERPAWNFNKLLYIEKEGAQEALKQNRWLERHDCAVMSSKGFSTRAARDLIDKLVEHDEPVEVFCVHDADASGTMIYQTLQEATKARGARKIKIINLGLEPWEAIEMGLEVETLEETDARQACCRLRPRARRQLGGLAADPSRRTERDDDAATDRVARREDGRARRRQADPADRCAGAGAGRPDREQGPRRRSPNASCARPSSTSRSPPPSPRSRRRTARSSRATSRSCSSDSPTPNGATISRQLRVRDQRDPETALATVIMQENQNLLDADFRCRRRSVYIRSLAGQ